ncbi:MAG: OmpA family protein [Desulfobacterales bacterium]|nr:OmpA family protein [Desulfobacterales bacterium]
MKTVFTFTLMFIFIVIVMCNNALSDDLNFEDTEEGIIKALTKENAKTKIKAKTRGFKPRSINKKEVRGVTVVSDDDIEEPSVNLKIEFDVNSYSIRSDSFYVLGNLGRALQSEELKGKKIIIKGHTDSDGDTDYNMKLSFNRANTVKSYLVNNFSISKSKISVLGYGESKPLRPNTNSINKQLNRRVEIAVSGDL